MLACIAAATCSALSRPHQVTDVFDSLKAFGGEADAELGARPRTMGQQTMGIGKRTLGRCLALQPFHLFVGEGLAGEEAETDQRPLADRARIGAVEVDGHAPGARGP